MVLSNTLIIIIPLVIKQDIIATVALDGEGWAIKNRGDDQRTLSARWRKHRLEINIDSSFFSSI